MTGLRIRRVSDGLELDQVRSLLRDYQTHLATTIDPALLQHREEELGNLPGVFSPPAGALLLASHDGRPLGCAGLRPAPVATSSSFPLSATAEFCRLWVTPAARGQQLGELLLAHAIALARKAGYTTLVLNSVTTSMATAQALYRRAGFRPIPPYKHVPIPDIAFFGLDLVSAPAS